ncbi:MAG TPA: aldo/keto reductase [Lapillicoccus sp.]|nr:aldo/keto reductase [Lapillicoccus sp.]
MDLPTGAVLLGTSTLGQPDRPGATELAEAMVRSGFPAIDTANGYAAGRSEAYLGTAIGRVGLPDGTAVITKVDADPLTGVFDGDRVRRSFAESLERLGLDRVPLLHLHDPYTLTLAEAMAPGGAVPALVRLRDEGAVEAIGIAAGPVRLLLDYVETDAFDAVLTHNRFTLVDRSGGPVLRAARERGMLAINAAPFGGGILAGSTRHQDRYAYRPASEETLHRVGATRLACSRHGVPMDAAALAFSTRSPLVDATVVGVSSAMRLRRLHELVATDVPDDLLEELEALTADDR